MPPILVANLLPEVCQCLHELLRSLRHDEWELPTSSSQRTVKDIASHLLDGSLRRLSMQRDGYRATDGSSQPRADESLMAFLNRLNSEWETATRRLSPRVLTEQLAWADAQLATLFVSLDPLGPAIFPVAWAGEEQSANWMDIARDYTEKWHHTQQIFDATGRASTIMNSRLGYPCFDIFMRALPFAYRHVEAPLGSLVTITIAGAAGGSWHIERHAHGWRQIATTAHAATATVTVGQDAAWKVLTKRRSREAKLQQFPKIQFAGDELLASHFLDVVSVMA